MRTAPYLRRRENPWLEVTTSTLARKRGSAALPAGRKRATRRPANLARLRHQELLEACLYGRNDAWDEFVRRFSGLVDSVILEYGLPADEHEEAYQVSFVAAYEQLPRLKTPENLIPWLIGIASRQAVDRMRAFRRQAKIQALTGAARPDAPAHSCSPRAPDEEEIDG